MLSQKDLNDVVLENAATTALLCILAAKLLSEKVTKDSLDESLKALEKGLIDEWQADEAESRRESSSASTLLIPIARSSSWQRLNEEKPLSDICGSRRFRSSNPFTRSRGPIQASRLNLKIDS